jgi:para-nitrobenzyl esterase
MAIVLTAALGTSVPNIAHGQAPVVRFAEGSAAGSVRDGVTRFLGLPYAAPPVGALRWRAPEPPRPWSGVRHATSFAPACRQTAPWITERQSEDCLYLNIWAPAGPRKTSLPVIVWIHGGGFFGGSGAQPLYDGTRLARRGVIVVTLNYRLGLFGFFAHPELTAQDHVTGNQGVLDQVAALRWVKRNIAAVGGDPRRVTIMGESAGGESVAILTASTLATGLFQRAIAQSGNDGLPLTPDEAPNYDRTAAEGAGAALARRIGHRSLAELRRVPAEELLRQSWTPRTVMDGRLIPADMTTAYRRGRYNRVPLLVGWNSNEGIDLAPEILGTDRLDAASYGPLVTKLLRRPPSPALLAAYPTGTDAEARSSLERLTTDWWGWRMWSWARLHREARQAPTYVYYFIHWPAEPRTPCGYGCKAGHGAEIPFAFDQLDQDGRAWRPEDRLLSDQIATYWTNFARTGDPNGPNVPRWVAFDGNASTVQRLGSADEIKARGALPDFRLLEP